MEPSVVGVPYRYVFSEVKVDRDAEESAWQMLQAAHPGCRMFEVEFQGLDLVVDVLVPLHDVQRSLMRKVVSYEVIP
jgi:hypothetical protein